MKKLLTSLADKYEVASFCNEDPSQFLHWYKKGTTNIELASFIAAMLAFGSRTQFIPKIRQILQTADNSSGEISTWLKTCTYKKDFPTGTKKFYRFYSYNDMQIFFDELASLTKNHNSLGNCFHEQWKKSQQAPHQQKTPHLADIISQSFPKSRIVPKGKTSANKRLHMFLRWMVRQNSPVDLGLWSWYPQADLLIPLDVHVMQEAQKLGLLPPNATASRKTAITLTKKMEEVFPGDPARADYALFGLGVAPNLC
ncbi:MAG: TIGR02757 family protein [Treponema sp.]|nr:TIGR02757 family protein [Treponema sp.]